MFEGKLNEYNGNLQRAAVEVAKQWRGDKMLRQLEAMLLVMDKTTLLLVSGTGKSLSRMMAFGYWFWWKLCIICR